MSKLPREMPYTNTTKNNMHVGGKVIRPGHTRMVPTMEHPDYHKLKKTLGAAPAVDTRGEELKKLLQGNSMAVLKALGDGAGFTDSELEQLSALEGAAKSPRKGIRERIAAILLERAKAHELDGAGIAGILASEDPVAAIAAEDTLSLEELENLAAAETEGKNREPVLLAIEEKRNALHVAAAQELLKKPDAAEQILGAKDITHAELDLLEAQEIASKEPREAVAQAIETKRAELKAAGQGGGLLGFFRKKG